MKETKTTTAEQENKMNLLRTDRTYSSHKNAVKALETACTKLGITIDEIRYVIAATENGRFAPCVVGGAGTWSNTAFVHIGVTVIG